MAVGGGGRGRLWVDGRFAVRVRGPGDGPGRVIRLRSPFALIGRHPAADVRVDDPAAESRHAFLLLDRRGVFGVDLRTRGGTRFAGGAAASARLGAGDVLEVAGHRVELLGLRLDGSAFNPPLSDDDPLAEAGPSALASLSLGPLDAPGPPWMLGSALAFAGRGEACAIRVEGASGAHCALLRAPGSAYVIDLRGRRTLLNGRAVEGASALVDGDVLTLGPARFAVRVEPARTDLPPALPPRGGPPDMALEARRRPGPDAASPLEIQADRIEALGREVAALRAELRSRGGPLDEIPGPPRPGPPPLTPAQSVESASWLLERIHRLEGGSGPTPVDPSAQVPPRAGPRGLPGSPLDAQSRNRPGSPLGPPGRSDEETSA